MSWSLTKIALTHAFKKTSARKILHGMRARSGVSVLLKIFRFLFTNANSVSLAALNFVFIEDCQSQVSVVSEVDNNFPFF